MKEKQKFLHLLLILLTIVSAFPLTLMVHSQPPSSGDWIIDSEVTLSNETFFLNGSIVVAANGSLTLTNCILNFQLSEQGLANGELNLTVQAGGTIYLIDCTVTTDLEAFLTYIEIQSGATAIFENTRFIRIGYDSTHPGIIVNANDVVFDNCTLEIGNPAIAGIWIEDAENVQIINCEIQSDSDTVLRGTGIYLKNAPQTLIQGSTVQIIGTQGRGIILDNSKNCSIINNDITLYSQSTMIIAFTGNCSHALIEGNTLYATHTSVMGIEYYLSADEQPRDIRILNNNITLPNSADPGIVVYRSLTLTVFYDLVIKNNVIYCPEYIAITSSINENVEIDNNTITAKNYGIVLSAIEGGKIKITNNIVESTEDMPVLLQNAVGDIKEVEISNNQIIGGTDVGINIQNLANLTISSNVIQNLKEDSGWLGAIYLQGTTNATVEYNTIQNMPGDAIYAEQCNELSIHANTIENLNNVDTHDAAISLKTVNNTYITYNHLAYVDCYGVYIDTLNVGEANYNVTIANNSFQNVYVGINLYYAENLQVLNNEFNTITVTALNLNSNCNNFQIDNNQFLYISNTAGVKVSNCDNGTISNNHFSNIYTTCVYTSHTSNVIIGNNSFADSETGIYTYNEEIIIEYNTFESLYKYGIVAPDFFASIGPTIRYNNIYDCYKGIGISCANSVVYNNSFIMNYYGIELTIFSSSNLIYYNDFIDNIVQAYDETTGFKNNFSAYIPIPEKYLGNYWSDYTGVDEVEPFGIGDTPYYFDEEGYDEYPLMHGSTKIAPPSLSHPPDIIMFENVTGYTVTWIITSFFDNLTYVLTLNGSIVQSGTVEDMLVYTIPELAAGNYSLILNVSDPLGNYRTDEVLLIVLPSSVEETAPENFFETLDWTSVGIGAGAGAIVVILATVVISTLLRKPKQKTTTRQKKKSSKKKK